MRNLISYNNASSFTAWTHADTLKGVCRLLHHLPVCAKLCYVCAADCAQCLYTVDVATGQSHYIALPEVVLSAAACLRCYDDSGISVIHTASVQCPLWFFIVVFFSSVLLEM